MSFIDDTADVMVQTKIKIKINKNKNLSYAYPFSTRIYDAHWPNYQQQQTKPCADCKLEKKRTFKNSNIAQVKRWHFIIKIMNELNY